MVQLFHSLDTVATRLSRRYQIGACSYLSMLVGSGPKLRGSRKIWTSEKSWSDLRSTMQGRVGAHGNTPNSRTGTSQWGVLMPSVTDLAPAHTAASATSCPLLPFPITTTFFPVDRTIFLSHWITGYNSQHAQDCLST